MDTRRRTATMDTRRRTATMDTQLVDLAEVRRHPPRPSPLPLTFYQVSHHSPT